MTRLRKKSDFHSNEKSYRQTDGKSMKAVNILDELIDLCDKMDLFTEEEAIVQLMSSYKSKGYNTSLLMQFRDKYKNIIRWIRNKEYILNPQDYINYETNSIKSIPDGEIEKIKDYVIEYNGKLPVRFGIGEL